MKRGASPSFFYTKNNFHKKAYNEKILFYSVSIKIKLNKEIVNDKVKVLYTLTFGIIKNICK